MTRRTFTRMLATGSLAGCCGCVRGGDRRSLEQFVADQVEEFDVPGFAGAVCRDDRILWSGASGWADVNRRIPMSADTSINVASVSKTVTAAAVMQLWEKGAFQLDDDVSDRLPFAVRNPRFPDVPITYRQLLTHRSSIADGPAYRSSYACGEPDVDLADWIEGYLRPDGRFYNPEANFENWGPGSDNIPALAPVYSNVGFGLLGYMVEKISGESFPEYVDALIIRPLGMDNTGWSIDQIAPGTHAVPYSRIPDDFAPDPDRGVDSYLGSMDATADHLSPGALFPHCLYSFYNLPDGMLRSNANAMARFVQAMVNGGATEGRRILAAETVRTMMRPEHFGRRLCWGSWWMDDGRVLVAHLGNDPGVSTFLAFREEERIGVVALFNVDAPGQAMRLIVERLFSEAEQA